MDGDDAAQHNLSDEKSTPPAYDGGLRPFDLTENDRVYTHFTNKTFSRQADHCSVFPLRGLWAASWVVKGKRMTRNPMTSKKTPPDRQRSPDQVTYLSMALPLDAASK